MKEVYDVLLVYIPKNHTVAPTVTLAQNLLLLLSGRIPTRWLCQKRILIENILRNLHETSNKRIQMYGSPESLENSLMIFMSIPGTQEVFQLKDYGLHTVFLPVHQSLGEKLVQNCILLFSKLTPADWLWQERSLIEHIRNLYGDSNKRIQLYGSPESMEKPLLIFMSLPGNQQVFQPKDYDFHKTFLPVQQSLVCNNRIYRKDVFDVLLEYIPTMQTIAPTEKLDQNYTLLSSNLIPGDWRCDERSLIEIIRNLYGDSNHRIQMYGSPESLERCLMIFMVFPGNQLVFQPEDYAFNKIELGVDLTVENGKITLWKRNHATFEHVELEDDEGANRMAWARIARRPNLPWQVIDPRYAHVPDSDQTLIIKEETNRFHEEMDRIYKTGPSTSSMFVKWLQLNNNTRLQRMLIHFFH